MKILKIIFLALATLGLTGGVFSKIFAQPHSSANSQDTTSKNSAPALPSVSARKASAKDISLDGNLDEPVWKHAPVATGFTQRTPHDGKPATEDTEARIIYTEDALYVGIKAYDSAMDSVAATLFRRDGDAYSDWVYVNIDSYDDNRTSFSFAVNPRGVRKDILTYNNSDEDTRWDAVWEAETQIHSDSWTAELRIPLSQLRYSTKKESQQWGINFQRRIARKEEISFWAPTPQDASGYVSQYGNLQGLRGLKKPNRLELQPYASSSLTRAPGSSDNPFYHRNDVSASIGGDVKYGLSSDFTLTGTINPDFGQVEADPAVINLSANETYFDEQRPFFLEGTDIFQFGDTKTFNRFGNPIIFYSRRIGRQPQGNLRDAGIDANYVDRPNQTSIASAVKVSGKTENGLSVGVLNAFTTREKATYIDENDHRRKMSIEPPSNYFVGRMKKDFNGGDSFIGGYVSSVNRFFGADYLRSSLHDGSYIAGLDFEHSWNDHEWILSGVVSGTQVTGTKEAIRKTQLSSSRYYNRVDADYLSVNPHKTSLSGYAGEFSFARYSGTHWRGSFTYSVTSPGYEVNDIGFETSADYQGISYLVQYQETAPAHPFRFYNINLYANQMWDFGGDLTYNSIATSGSIDFTNLWSVNINAGYNAAVLDDRLLRGGPLAKRPASHYYSAVLQTDQSKMVSAAMGHLRRNDVTGGKERDVFVDLTIRPTSYIQLTLSPNYNFQRNTSQYVRQVSDDMADQTYDHRYVFSDIDQTTFSTSLRLDWTFTPDISLQTYVRPFITSGNYSNYKEFTTPRKYDFNVYGEDAGIINKSDGIYTVDPDGSGAAESFTFADPDFNFRSIQANAVFRWEYRPGSTLFLVWQQDRRSSDPLNDFRLGRDFRGIFNAQPTNIFLIKLSYWLGS